MVPKTTTVRTTRRRRRALEMAVDADDIDMHLEGLAVLLAHETAGGPPTIVRITRADVGDSGVDVGLRPVGDVADGVIDALVGFVAPADWLVVGAATGGNAHRLDDRAPAGRAHAVHLVSRRGRAAAAVSLDGADPEVVPLAPGEPIGRLDDVCRRALGLATPSPSRSTIELWAVLWLERVVQAGPHESWPAVAALHPAIAALAGSEPALVDEGVRRLVRMGGLLAEVHDWTALRLACGAGHWDVDDVPPAVARWLDDGSFSRFVLAAFPPVSFLIDAAGEALPSPLARRVRATVRQWGLDG